MKKQFRKSPWAIVAALLILSGLSLGVQGLFGTSDSNSTRSEHSHSKKPSSNQLSSTIASSEKRDSSSEQFDPEEMSAEQIQQIFTGFWTSEYYGTRHLTIKNDGTATIYYQPSLLASFVVGNQLTINYQWEYDPDNTQVIFTVISGHPAKSFNYVLDKWGKTQRQTVINASKDMLLLLDLDGKTEHHWHRLDAIDEQIIKKSEKP